MHHPSAGHGGQQVVLVIKQPRAYLVVEPTLAVQEFEELRVRLASPEVKVTNLEVAPDYSSKVSTRPIQCHRS